MFELCENFEDFKILKPLILNFRGNKINEILTRIETNTLLFYYFRKIKDI